MPKRREGPVKNKYSGVYYIDIYIGFPPDKKRIRYSLRTTNPAKARWLWEREYEKQWKKYYGLETPERPEPAKLFNICKEFIDYQRDVRRVKEWKTAKGRLQKVLDLWGDISLNEITSIHFTELDRWLREHGRSENTVNHYIAILKTLFNYARKKGKFHGDNPALEITPYTIDEKRREYTVEELKRILEAAERIEKEASPNALIQKHIKRIILLLLLTGMRMGEALNLRWENVLDDKIVLKRTETKQKKEKVIPMTKGIRTVLDSIEIRDKSGYVFPLRRRSGQMKAAWANPVARKIREYSGVDDFIFHNIRHTASTILVSNALGKGVGIGDIMKILGHSQIKTTMKYIHSDFDRMKVAMEVLEKKTSEGNQRTEEGSGQQKDG